MSQITPIMTPLNFNTFAQELEAKPFSFSTLDQVNWVMVDFDQGIQNSQPAFPPLILASTNSSVITGTSGDDTLNGTSADDTIDGLEGDDTINGRGGNDTLTGGTGTNTVNGGGGDDAVTVTVGPADTVDTIDGGIGFDTVTLQGVGFGWSIDYVDPSLTGGFVESFDNGVQTRVEFTRVERIESIDNGTSIFVWSLGTTGNDTLDASAETAQTALYGGDGNDTLIGGTGSTLIVAGRGNDSVDGGAGGFNQLRFEDASGSGLDLTIGLSSVTDNISGDVDTYTNINWIEIFGGSLASVIDGSAATVQLSMSLGAGDDTLIGGAAGDFLQGREGADTYTGNAGSDSFQFARLSGELDGDVITDFSGDDQIQIFTFLETSTFIGDAAFSNSAGELRYSFSAGQTLLEFDADGDGVADEIATIANGEFDLAATIMSSEYILRIVNSIDGTSGDDTLVGTSGDDTINGLEGNDILSGLDGDDTLNGGDGNDTLDGGAGSNTLNGEAGDDLIILNPNGDEIVDGGTGFDTARVTSTFNRFVSVTNNANPLDNAQLFLNFITTLSNVERVESVDSGGTLLGLTLLGSSGAETLDASGDTVDVTLYGGDGDDTLIGGTGNFNTLNPGAGNDVITGNGSFDLLQYQYSGSSADSITVAASTITDNASGDVDTFTGIDTIAISTFDGDDVIDASAATIRVEARLGAGNDTFTGGLGNDFIEVGAGNNTIDGGGGSDFLFVPYSNFVFSSGLDVTITDTQISDPTHGTNMLTSIENVQIQGTGMNDRVDASAATLSLFLFGQTGDDELIGGSNNDSISGDFGADTLTGGAGFDQFQYFNLTGALDGDVITDFSSEDAILIFTFSASVTFIADAAFTGVAGELRYIKTAGQTLLEFDANGDGAADETATISNGEFDLVQTDVFSSQFSLIIDPDITGTPGDDTLIGSDRAQIIDGLAGNDVIDARGGVDTVNGGEGSDTISGGDGDDTLNGDEGDDIIDGDNDNDTINGGAGNDILTGSQGVNTVNGGDGDDQITIAVDGIDTVDGGAGYDTVISDARINGWIMNYFDPVNSTVTFFRSGVSSFDTIGNERFNSFDSGVMDRVFFLGSAAGDTIDASAETVSVRIFSGDGDDILTGGSLLNIYNGGAGSDTINGNALADDILQIFLPGIDAWNLTITDTSVTDNDSGDVDTISSVETVQVFADNVNTLATNIQGGTASLDIVLSLTDGDDTIATGSGNDFINLRGGDDTIDSGAGDDLINAGQGGDTITTGDGNDTIEISVPSTDMDGDIITDFSETDVLRIFDFNEGTNFIGDAAFSSTAGEVRFETSAGQTLVLLDSDGDGVADATTTISNGEFNLTTAVPFGGAYDIIIDPNITGTSGDDTLTGTDASQTIDGLEGNDTIDGAGGDDTINGGDGNDIITGGAGANTINAGDGDDEITVTAGADDDIDGGTGFDTVISEIPIFGWNVDEIDPLANTAEFFVGGSPAIQTIGVERVESYNAGVLDSVYLLGSASGDTLDASAETVRAAIFTGDGDEIGRAHV